ncbi:phospholipase D-like domain-containing protein [Tardiphaga sp. 37S4]|uniref:phospholipase D-like domain-containing protein n=1 Tax=Tardiphaga sp. 37S4 TaxID=1404741 RepID=UPI001E4BE76E|nr:phospholipase D-like domain-containing protein [Tardiphaga sp. 37S4]UFS77027.1 phospholipase D-like domain-containing protein [Tardiphaga sp. 37S4]
MRVTTSAGAFEASAIAGTRAIMIALNCDEAACKGLLGFAFRRARGAGKPEFLRSLKVFEAVEPNPDTEHGEYFTDKFPIQSFLWSDYTAEPGTTYHFEVIPVFGDPTAPELRDAEKLAFTVTTEKEDDGQHGIWFNRGAIASQAYARKFKNHKPTEAEMDNPKDEHTVWLSRGLLEACLDYIDTTKKSEALRACIYEFTYAPIIEALKTKIDDGFDVRLIVHDDKKGKNRKAMKAAGLDVKAEHNGEPVVIWRTRPPIPHNKFIIKLDGDAPQEVWTGSTNITPSGFLGQSNVGHLVHDSDVAEQYLKYWTILSDNPTGKPAKEGVAEISPYPPALVKPGSQTCIFSPRQTASMLNWYADRMSDATSSIMFTAAFNVAADFIEPLARDRDFLRFVLKEKPPTADERKALKGDRDLQISFGAVLGAEFKVVDGKLVAKRKVKEFPLDRWFLKEELTRDEGNIFFVHTKYLLIDPLSDDPLICTGSANFSGGSLTTNDENMILIRGSTRVADIYMTEFDRLFRHFYFRDVANDVASKRKKGEKPEKVFLDPDDRWTESYFKPGGFKSRRREMFFTIPASNWTVNAATHSNDEPVRPPKKKKAAKAVAKKAKTKTAKKKTTKKTAKAASAKKAKTVKSKKVAKAKVKKAKTKTTKAKKAKTKTSKAKKSKAKSKR